MFAEGNKTILDLNKVFTSLEPVHILSSYHKFLCFFFYMTDHHNVGHYCELESKCVQDYGTSI